MQSGERISSTFHVRPAAALRSTRLSALAIVADSNLAVLSWAAHCDHRGMKHSSTQATTTAIAAAAKRSGRTIVRNPMPLARIATISEWRQNTHIV